MKTENHVVVRFLHRVCNQDNEPTGTPRDFGVGRFSASRDDDFLRRMFQMSCHRNHLISMAGRKKIRYVKTDSHVKIQKIT